MDSPRRKSPWQPVAHPLTAADVPDASVQLLPDGLEEPTTLLGGLTLRQHVVATRFAGRVLAEQYDLRVALRVHRVGLRFLEIESGDSGRRLGFVATAESSMEPRPVWPVLLPAQLLQLVAIDWFVACTVPKEPNLEDVEGTERRAYLTGWLPAERITDMPLVESEPHIGHPFAAEYRQARNKDMWPLQRIGELADAGGEPPRVSI